ncbi:tetratricopeptide repeat protein [Glaciecola sp. 1036]|uniref:tetratricopeptide repeat protein n=1 Tax=Alteromonadaceae TaxID=72275 RepID=UPI003D070DD8
MSEQKGSSADEQILARQQQMQKKLKTGVWVASGVILLFLIIFWVRQWVVNPTIEAAPSDIDEPIVSLSSEQAESARRTFREALAAFEQNLQPQLEQKDLVQWAQSRVNELVTLKEIALTNFASSKYHLALSQIEQLETSALALIEDWQSNYQIALQQSQDYLAQGNISRARLMFQQAQNIMPMGPGSEELKAQLDNFDRLADLNYQLGIAEVENNLDRQAQMLTELVNLSVSKEPYIEKLQSVQRQIKQRDLSALLVQGNQALTQDNLLAAQKAYQAASKLEPTAIGVKQLGAAIQSKQSKSRLTEGLAQLEALINEQNWSQVETLSSALAKQYPEEPKFAKALEQAKAIGAQQKRLALFLSRPERLADAGIRESAVQSLQQALPYSIDSSALTSQVQQLAALIDQYQQPIQVQIQSDGASYVLVLGVGHVGEIENKTIELKPGKYTLEARRKGYKSKRIPIEVSEGKDNSFYIACDEQI